VKETNKNRVILILKGGFDEKKLINKLEVFGFDTKGLPYLNVQKKIKRYTDQRGVFACLGGESSDSPVFPFTEETSPVDILDLYTARFRTLLTLSQADIDWLKEI
jgi:hypothetical protein